MEVFPGHLSDDSDTNDVEDNNAEKQLEIPCDLLSQLRSGGALSAALGIKWIYVEKTG